MCVVASAGSWRLSGCEWCTDGFLVPVVVPVAPPKRSLWCDRERAVDAGQESSA